MKMNLEQTVQYLLDATGNGVRIEAFFTDPNNISPSAETFGKYYIVTIDEVRHLFVVTKTPELGEEVYDKIDLGEWPKPGAQGVPGPQGQTPEIKISPTGTWVINGIDTEKPSRGIKGEQGPTGVGRPGLGVTSMLGINGEDYSTDVTKLDDGYDLYTTMADIEYDAGDSTQTIPVEFKYLVKTNVFEEQAEVTPTAIHFTKNIAVDGSVNTNQVMVPSFSNIKSPSTNLDTQLRSKMPIPANSPIYNYSFVYGTGGAWTTNNTHVMQGIAGGTNANTVMMRDSFGRAAIADPHSNTDIANKKYVDDAVAGAGGGGKIYLHRLVWLKNPDVVTTPNGDVELDIYVPGAPNPRSGGQTDLAFLLERAIAPPTITFSVSGEAETAYSTYNAQIYLDETVRGGLLNPDLRVYVFMRIGTTVNAFRKEIALWEPSTYAFYEDVVEEIELS